jgi:integrase
MHRSQLSARFLWYDSVWVVELAGNRPALTQEGAMSVQPLLDAAGRRRSPATTPGFRTGIAPRNKGQRYPADPPTVDEIVAVMRQAGHDRHGHRLTALIVVLWRAGLRIHEALSLTETDLDQRAAPFWSSTAKVIAGARSAWTPGRGQRSSHGQPTAPSCPSGHCSA